MSAVVQFEPGAAEVSRTCQILILCEDLAAYEQARDICWRILVQLADDLDFSFNCWKFYELSEADSAQAVLRSAKNSDVILMSLRQASLPPAAEACLDALVGHRLRAEGLLALVLNEPNHSPEAVDQLVGRLEQAARRLAMDFLSLVHPPVPPTAPAVIFSHDAKPFRNLGEWSMDHWGLNE
jgi:hypothetical protein